MDAEAYRNKTVPSPESLYEKAQALMSGGAETVGNTPMVGTHRLPQHPETAAKLRAESKGLWPVLVNEPKLRDLEKLPYLNSVIK